MLKHNLNRLIKSNYNINHIPFYNIISVSKNTNLDLDYNYVNNMTRHLCYLIKIKQEFSYEGSNIYFEDIEKTWYLSKKDLIWTFGEKKDSIEILLNNNSVKLIENVENLPDIKPYVILDEINLIEKSIIISLNRLLNQIII